MKFSEPPGYRMSHMIIGLTLKAFFSMLSMQMWARIGHTVYRVVKGPIWIVMILDLDNLTKDSLLWQPGMSWGVLRDAGVGKMSRLGFHLLKLFIISASGSWCMDHPHWADQSEHIRKGNQDGHFRHGGYHCIFLRPNLYESYYAAILKHFCKKTKTILNACKNDNH